MATTKYDPKQTLIWPEKNVMGSVTEITITHDGEVYYRMAMEDDEFSGPYHESSLKPVPDAHYID